MPEHPRRQKDVPVEASDWLPSASAGGLTGFVMIAVAVLLAVFALWRVGGAEGTTRVSWVIVCVALLVLAGIVAWLLRGLSTLQYVLNESHLIIIWMRTRRVLPLTDIISAEYDPHAPLPVGGWEPFWPGYHVSQKRTPQGTWHIYATLPARQCVRVQTVHGVFAISPQRPVSFLVELDRLRAGVNSQQMGQVAEAHSSPARESFHTPPFGWERFGAHADDDAMPSVDDAAPPRVNDLPDVDAVPSVSTRETAVRGGPTLTYLYQLLFRQQLLKDRVASNFIAAGVILPLLMVAYLYSQYEGIAALVPIHWNAVGEVDRAVEPRALWRFPLMAMLILIGNVLLATLLMAVDRFLARLLAAAIPIVQIMTFIALLRAVS